MTPKEKLARLGITLPPCPSPLANYVPYRIAGDLVFISGQIPVINGEVACKGAVGGAVSLDDARAAGRVCAVNLLAVAREAAGDLSRVEFIRVEGFVASAPGFTGQASVINGASDFLVEILGDAGKHSRFAVGVSDLPAGACVEIGAVIRIVPSE